MLAIAPSTAAASATVRPCGPTVSWVAAIGTTPARLVSPTVGLMPTTPLAPDGQTIEPSVSVPIAAAHRLADAGGTRTRAGAARVAVEHVGFLTWPPRPDQPLDEWNAGSWPTRSARPCRG